jgi:hypothetical protein
LVRLASLEPAREFVKSLNQAANLLSSPNPSEMTTLPLFEYPVFDSASPRVREYRVFVFGYGLIQILLREDGQRHHAGPQSVLVGFG